MPDLTNRFFTMYVEGDPEVTNEFEQLGTGVKQLVITPDLDELASERICGRVHITWARPTSGEYGPTRMLVRVEDPDMEVVVAYDDGQLFSVPPRLYGPSLK